MFSNAMAILPVVDMQRARKFYGETLGLKLANENPAGVTFASADGANVFLYGRGATKADHTVMGLQVDNLEVIMSDLRAKGVAFEEYDEPLKTVDGVVTMGPMKGAWLKDTEGNIIGLIQM